MKNVIKTLITLLFLSSLAGCSEDKKNKEIVLNKIDYVLAQASLPKERLEELYVTYDIIRLTKINFGQSNLYYYLVMKDIKNDDYKIRFTFNFSEHHQAVSTKRLDIVYTIEIISPDNLSYKLSGPINGSKLKEDPRNHIGHKKYKDNKISDWSETKMRTQFLKEILKSIENN